MSKKKLSPREQLIKILSSKTANDAPITEDERNAIAAILKIPRDTMLAVDDIQHVVESAQVKKRGRPRGSVPVTRADEMRAIYEKMRAEGKSRKEFLSYIKTRFGYIEDETALRYIMRGKRKKHSGIKIS